MEDGQPSHQVIRVPVRDTYGTITAAIVFQRQVHVQTRAESLVALTYS